VVLEEAKGIVAGGVSPSAFAESDSTTEARGDEEASGIVAGDVSPLAFDESDSTTEARWDEVGAVGGAEGSFVGDCGVSPLAAMLVAVKEADEGPRESEEPSIASAAECISVGDGRERYTVVDAERE
jgi:hypothetical protein